MNAYSRNTPVLAGSERTPASSMKRRGRGCSWVAYSQTFPWIRTRRFRIDAGPADAILAPYVLDSRKCISYTTIELRGEIPESERDGIGHHLYGCDICQDVCPWNRKAPVSLNEEFQPKPGLFWPEIEALLNKDDAEWRELIRGSAMRRAKVKGLLRNLMVVA